MLRNGFENIFSSALDFRPDGLTDMQAFALENSHLSDAIERSVVLWKIRFDCAPLARLRVYKQKYWAIGKQLSFIFVFSINSLHSLWADFLDAFSVRSRAINKRSERSSTAGFSGKCYNKKLNLYRKRKKKNFIHLSIRERKRKVKNSPRPRHLHLKAILSPS